MLMSCIYLFKKIIYFWFFFFLAAPGLHCCVRAFSSISERGLLSSYGVWVSHCSGFSCWGACSLGIWASVVMLCGLSCGSWALEHRLCSCGTWDSLPCSMWDLPGPGIEPVSPALTGRFLTTGPLGKSELDISWCPGFFQVLNSASRLIWNEMSILSMGSNQYHLI